MFWLDEVTPELAMRAQAVIGTATALPTLAAWQALWDDSGLQERVVKVRQIDPTQELKDRVEWIGRRWLGRAWGRALPLVITQPGIRQSIWHYFDQTEPRLGLARLGRFIPTFRTGYRVVRYRLGEARDVQD